MGLLLALAMFLLLQEKIATQQKSSQLLQSHIALLDHKIKDIEALQKENQALLIRQHAVEDLQFERNIPVYLMTELAKQLPEGVYITSLRRDTGKVTLQGISPTAEKVADFLQNMSLDSMWFTRPELLEVVSGSANLATKAGQKVSSFSLRFLLKRSNLSAPADSMAPEVTKRSSP
jgi:type IV pilus assembly protein PilN